MRRVASKNLLLAFVLIFPFSIRLSHQFDSDVYPNFPQLLTDDLRIRHFLVKKDHRLRGKIKAIKVQSDFTCIQHCMKDSCTSVNFGKAGSNGVHVCELITSETTNAALDKGLEADGEFNFISMAQFPVINKDCDEIYKKGGGRVSGVYSISPTPSRPIQVYCDMVTSGGGWTVIQKRMDGSVDFDLGWADYKRGFGNKLGEYWLGLENIHMMTSQRSYRLRVDMEDFDGNKRYAEYGLFNVADEADKYRLSIGVYSGNASNSMDVHDGMQFSTKDSDNDQDHMKSCATRYKGAWWFNNCLSCNPNGYYYPNCKNSCPAFEGIVWNSWHGGNYSLKRFEMKILPNVI